jgi:hypothetical protein
LIAAVSATVRQRADLAAAKSRHDESLAHARALEDRAELRKVLDDAAATLATAVDTLGQIALRVEMSQHFPRHDQPSVAELNKQLLRQLPTVGGHRQRIALRLGRSDLSVYRLYSDVIDQISSAASTIVTSESSDLLVDHLKEYSMTATHSLREFLDQAVVIVGTRQLPGIEPTLQEMLKKAGR